MVTPYMVLFSGQNLRNTVEWAIVSTMTAIRAFFYISILGAIGLSSATASDKSSQDLKRELAETYGLEAFSDINKVSFTFLVDFGQGTAVERQWEWNPGMNEVTFFPSDGNSVTFDRQDPGQADLAAKFVNDSYWLVFPFMAYWDDTAVLTEAPKLVDAPLSGTPMRKITVDHPADVGFTPGDAYDLYLDGEGVVREWVFRKGGQPEPSRITTWEDYQDFSGIQIALDHINPDGFRVYFENVSVE